MPFFPRFHSSVTILLSIICVVLTSLVLFLSPSMSSTFPLLKIDMTLGRFYRWMEIGDAEEFMQANYYFNRTGYPDFFEIGVLGICKVGPGGNTTCQEKDIGYKFNLFELLVNEYEGDMISPEQLVNFNVARIGKEFPGHYMIEPYFNKIQNGSSAVIAGFAVGLISVIFYLISEIIALSASTRNFKLIQLSVIFQFLGILLGLACIIATGLSSVLLYNNCKGFSRNITQYWINHGMSSTTPKESVFSFLFAAFALYLVLIIWTVALPVGLYFRQEKVSNSKNVLPTYDQVIAEEVATQYVEPIEQQVSEKELISDHQNDAINTIARDKNSTKKTTYDSRYGPIVFQPWLNLMQIPKDL